MIPVAGIYSPAIANLVGVLLQTDKIQAMRVCYYALQGSSNAKQARIQELEATVSQHEFVNQWQQVRAPV